MKIEFIEALNFTPKNNTTSTYLKKYSHLDNYIIEIDLEKNTIDFGNHIFFNDSKNSVQQIVKPEDSVVLECIDRLLIKGYSPKNITLEKRYPSGHGHSGRLDILVSDENNKAYMMIECKTWGKEFDKEFTKLNKDGGQLFTYFQNDKDTQILVLYTSSLIDKKIEYKNEIIKIEEEYRNTSNVKDFFDRWNKVSKNNGIFNDWNTPYNYESKALTPKDLIDIKQEDSSFIFNRFMEILRHNVVSDKPNAFNKIFTLFLCKIMDEKSTNKGEELDFQWKEGIDDHIKFQKRLTDLYQRGMKEFLDKEVTDLSDEEFEDRFGLRLENLDSSIKKEILDEFTKIRLQKNNEFAIKDVFDAQTFEENAIVVKEIVELLQGYRIRYTKKQQFLSDFFELLLTTGLKQEVGQFFTPVPIAKFIIRSIPFDKIIKEKLEVGEKDELLPNVIDYAVGSGHFITEAMDEIQKNILDYDTEDLVEDIANEVKSWKVKHFNWAYDYVYGIEKDYRLVKTAKVGCYLHGDGLAKVIHGDGLSNFTTTKEFKGKLKYSDKNYPQDNKKFDVVVSNPPYSVSAFKNVSKTYDKNDFELYNRLTDQSSEIEALFIERTKQLLKDGGIAGIVLPDNILTGSRIYEKTREIMLKYFDIISIAKLGSNTFMATEIKTFVIFLRRKNNMININIQSSIDKLYESKKDITINGIENPLSKYLSYVWEDISFDDYLTLIDKDPNKNIVVHEIFREYSKKYSDEKIAVIEKEKFFYFLLAYGQKVTLVKTGEKKEEKKFLGYEFSNRRGSEGIHPIQRGKSIDDCTSLYDNSTYKNSSKVNSYIYSAFKGNTNDINEDLQGNLSYVDLLDMMEFDRADFDKIISVNTKKKIKIETKWDIVKLGENIEFKSKSKRPASYGKDIGKYPFYTSSNELIKYCDEADYLDENIIIGDGGKSSIFIDKKFSASDHNFIFSSKNDDLLNQFVFHFFNNNFLYIENGLEGQNLKNISKSYIYDLKIPLPPKDIQKHIIDGINTFSDLEKDLNEEIKEYRYKVSKILNNLKFNEINLDDISTFKNGLNYNKSDNGESLTIVGVGDFQDNFSPNIKKLQEVTIDGSLNSDYELQNSDILVVRSNGSANLVGRFLYIDNLEKKTSFSGFTIRIRPNDNINSKFLCYFLKTDLVRDKLTKDSKGSNIKSLNQKLLSSIKVPLPSIDEQKKILEEIEVIELEISKREKELKNIPKQKEEILNKYLK
jgi:type I restriction enzyme M protein